MKEKGMTSIARKINFHHMLRQASSYLRMDFFLCIALGGVFLYGLDVSNAGAFSLQYNRYLVWGERLRDAAYQVGMSRSDILYTVEIGSWLCWMGYAAVFVGMAQLVDIALTAAHGTQRVRNDLKPLDEIAAKAQKLSKLTFDDTKYHNLEDAISKLKVETMDEGIHMHDKDLRGIETALNDLLARIRASYKQQAQFVSDASHELRTPIAVIQGYVNMLDRWGKEDAAILEESIKAIQHESDHMQKLVEQLLFLARGDSNRQTLDMQTYCLNDIMKEVYEESLMIDEKRHYTFEERGRVMVYGDCALLKQSARILLDNAVKYSDENGDIAIRVGAWKDGSAFYSVQDAGIGMAQQDVEHIFDRFYRADTVRNSKTGGTGLGLSIAEWIIDSHQAYFDIVSREGLGTRFSVIFPKN